MFDYIKKNGIFGYNYRYVLTHPWVFFKQCWLHTKWFCQRGWRGYADRDTWSIDWYLSSWMPEALGRLSKHGYPGDMCSHDFSDSGCPHEQDHMNEWATIMRKITDGFRAARIQNIYAYRLGQARYDRLEKVREEGMDLFVKHYHSLWD